MSEPITDPDQEAVDRAVAASDGTLGGYIDVHDRPPAYEGSDGHPYTVSIEVEKTANLRAPWLGYLVFPRWAQTGVGIVGHVETPTLIEARSDGEVREKLAALSLHEVQALLEKSIQEESIRSREI